MFELKDDKRYMKNRIVAVSAGGTGGHIFPALSVARLLIQEGYFVYFFTDKKISNSIKQDDAILHCGMFEIIELCAKNAPRYKQVIMILKDLWRCRKIITEKVSLCIGFGGLVSFSPVLVGVLSFKKTIIHEQNAVIGLANKLLLPFVNLCLLTFEKTKGIKKKYSKKCFFVGSPIREEIKKLVYNYDNPSVNYRAFYKIDDVINLTILGGSQACQAFDEMLPTAISMLPNAISNKLIVHHQCKERDVDDLEKYYTQHGISHEVKPFFYDVGKLLRASHIVISRAGSTTISEICALGVPSILIPLPTSANNHQYENAKFLRDKNGTILLEQSSITAENLSMLLTNLFTHDFHLFELSQSARKLAVINADIQIVAIINNTLGNEGDVEKFLKEKNNISNVAYINNNVGLG